MRWVHGYSWWERVLAGLLGGFSAMFLAWQAKAWCAGVGRGKVRLGVGEASS